MNGSMPAFPSELLNFLKFSAKKMYPALLSVKYLGFFFGRSPDGVNNIVYGYNEGRTNVAWEDYEKKEMLRFLLFESKVATVFYF